MLKGFIDTATRPAASVFAGVLGYLGFICSTLLLVTCCSSLGDLESLSPPWTMKAFVLAGSILAPAAGLSLVFLGRRNRGPMGPE